MLQYKLRSLVRVKEVDTYKSWIVVWTADIRESFMPDCLRETETERDREREGGGWSNS